jgi:hypothetical protein
MVNFNSLNTQLYKQNKWRTLQMRRSIDTLLPKFEEVQFSVLDADYWKVTVLNVFVFF